MSRRYVVVAIVALIIGVLSITKSTTLFKAKTDGDGIGINFLIFEIADNVKNENIQNYGWSFLVSGIFFILISLLLAWRLLRK
ncbi:hypothetical protein [Paenibacillus sp. PL91]|uniref:hypothetical protein n=1 Tax=Paenibacillus sp. PL91 TaxID=2729538 RepID=UPI00145D8B19|nr:hypothetical protein [Paenibacillus sp. PL91]MBC9204662.1 hypothetical protein [Paenibacillus sp. PL91]